MFVSSKGNIRGGERTGDKHAGTLFAMESSASWILLSKNEKSSLTKDYVSDIVKLSNILGRLEVYLLDKKDLENAHYICKWFEKEFEDEYSMEDFKDWLNDNE